MVRFFNPSSDYIEMHVININTDDIIYTISPFNNYNIPGTFQPGEDVFIEDIIFNPDTDLKNLGIVEGNYKVQYNILRPKINGSSALIFFIKEISSNKKELPRELVASYEKGGGKVVLGNELRAIIENNGFQINLDKVRLAYKTQRQKVTGLIVNKKVNITRIYLRNVNATLHNWETQGLKVVVDKYTSEYAKKRTIPDKKVAPFLDSLRGKIEFIGSVRGKDDHIYQKFIQKFESLRHREEMLNDNLD
jgi:RNA-directed DNA polymerase